MIKHLAALFLLLFCIEARASELDRVVAVVNNDAITWLELYKAMEFELSRGDRQPSDEEKAKLFKDNEVSFLDEMITMKLELQEARRLGIRISDAEVDDAIKGIRKTYSMDDEAFGKALREEGFTLEEYRKRLADDIAVGRVVEREVRSRVSVSPEEAARYIEEAGAAPEGGESYRLRQIFFRAGEDPSGAEERAASAYKRLDAGEDFASLASRVSEDPSGQKGGDLGYVKTDDLAPEFLEAVEGLKPGGISKPFRTPLGVHIVKFEGKGGGEAEDKARRMLLDKKFSEAYKKWIKGLRERSFVEIRL